MALGNCPECGYFGVLDDHHIIPRNEGGADTPENKTRLCANCHRDIHTKCLYRVNMFGESRALWEEARDNNATNIAFPEVDRIENPSAYKLYFSLKRWAVAHSGLVALTITDMSNNTGVSRGGIINCLKQLERGGFVERLDMTLRDAKRAGLLDAHCIGELPY